MDRPSSSDSVGSARSGGTSRTVRPRVIVARLLVDALLIGLVIALLPGISVRFTSTWLGLSLMSLGYGLLVQFIRPVLNLVLLPFLIQSSGLVLLVLAPIADRGRERQLMVGAGVILIVSLVVMAFATELWQWVAARAVLGAAQGAIGPAARRVALSWDQENEGRALGDLLAVGALGFVVGPPIGALLGTIDLGVPFLVPAALLLVAIPRLTLIQPGTMAQRDGGHAMLRLLRRPRLRVGVMLGASNDLANGVVGAVYALFMADLGADLALTGVGFLALVVPVVLLNPYAGRLAQRMNPIRIALGAVLIEIPIMVRWGWSSSPAVLLLIGGVQAVVLAFLEAPAQTAVPKASQALMEVSGLALTAIGALLAAPIYQTAGPRWLFTALGAWFAIVALTLLVRRSDWIDHVTPGAEAAGRV